MVALDTPENIAATFCATLVDEWILHGVRHAMIAPGSRSTPLALALAARSELTVHVFHDERSASFAALGAGLCGHPAILLCSSGTATAHFHAAVVEAHQSAVPLIVCTADRPPELRDVAAPQTIDQTKLYGSAVRWFHDPGVASAASASSWRSLASHVHGATTGLWPGPVHLNLPFREPLVGTPGPLPARRSAAAVSAPAAVGLGDVEIRALVPRLTGCGLIVAGRGCGDPQLVAGLAQALQWPILADARSGLRHVTELAVTAADHLLRDTAFARDQTPAVVLRLGELPASKVLNQWLEMSGAEHIHIGATPTWTDPDATLQYRAVADPGRTSAALTGLVTPTEGSWLRRWIDAERLAQQRITDALDASELTEPSVARSLASLLPPEAHLVVSSSMPIRDVEWFGIVPAGITVHSNRGANGIDGVIATAIGVAIASGAPTGVLIGDVALLHDSSSLVALARRAVDIRIVVIDNDGGGIFSFLPQAALLPDAQFEQLFGTPHGTDLVALAAAHGLRARTVTTMTELRVELAVRGPHLVRIATNRAANVAVHQRLNDLARR